MSRVLIAAPAWRQLVAAGAAFALTPTLTRAADLRQAREGVSTVRIQFSDPADQRLFGALVSLADAVRPRGARRERLAPAIGAAAEECRRLLDGEPDDPQPPAAAAANEAPARRYRADVDG